MIGVLSLSNGKISQKLNTKLAAKFIEPDDNSASIEVPPHDTKVFLTPQGEYLILGNITGPGGALWMKFSKDLDDWDEVILDDDGNIEDY